MSHEDPAPQPAASSAGASLGLLLLLFAGSGCAALIYEVVWLQLLQLVIGSTAVSLGVLLGTFMGGMCAGSLLLPRLVPARWNPLKVYALLELGIGAIALLVLHGMPIVEHLYVRHASPGLAGILVRGALAGVCLIPPTLLMGATLPAIARRVEADPHGVSWLGVFYGGNIVGAVIGCLAAGFYLLPFHDMPTATYTAAAINLVVAVVALLLSMTSSQRAPSAAPSEEAAERPVAGSLGVYVAIALSGMSALGAEVVWTRLLSLMLGATVYTFSLILAVFLVGLGIGSTVGSLLARRASSGRVALGVCQWLLTAAIAWTAAVIARSLPYWPIVPDVSPSPWFTLQLDLVRCLWAVLPPACLWGASFPLALSAVAARGQDPGRLVGGVYAANTVGAIAGALVFSLWLIPAIGTAHAEQVLIGLAAASALAALLTQVKPAGGRLRLGAALSLVVATAIAGGLAWSIIPVPWIVVAFGRESISVLPQAEPGIVKEVPASPGDHDTFCTYVGEGTNVSVAVTITRDGVRSFHGAGKVQASSQPDDMRLQRMLGHMPALLHKKPESVLVVACGAGVTAGTFVLHPDVKRIVICDIEPLVPNIVTPMFGTENYHVVDGIAHENPHIVNGKQVQVVYDDGRHFLETTHEKFDIITSDPIDPWVKGCAALNTVEYYQRCREHLNPGGMVTLWLPLYESNLETSRSLIATFFRVFPGGILWSNERAARGYETLWGEGRYAYDAMLFGQDGPTVIDIDALQRRLDDPRYQAVRDSLREVGFGEIDEMGDQAQLREESIDLLTTFAGDAAALEDWSRKAQINTDLNLRLQYLAGLAFNSRLSQQILNDILSHYRFPEQIFVGSPERLRALRQALDRAGRKAPAAPKNKSGRPAG